MRIGRVVGHAPRRPDSPSPCIPPRAPSDPPPEAPSKQRACLILMIVPGTSYSTGLLGCCSFQSEIGVGVKAEFEFNKVNVPVSKRDFSRVKVDRIG
eukprot:1156190-Pelagomonas_calceolata.AAC.1